MSRLIDYRFNVGICQTTWQRVLMQRLLCAWMLQLQGEVAGTAERRAACSQGHLGPRHGLHSGLLGLFCMCAVFDGVHANKYKEIYLVLVRDVLQDSIQVCPLMLTCLHEHEASTLTKL
jgi:hypothetical protein